MTRTGLSQVTAFLSRMAAADIAELDGVSIGACPPDPGRRDRRRRAMEALDVDEFELCPWALREGVILSRLDRLTGA